MAVMSAPRELDLVGYGLEKGGALLPARIAVGPERLLGGLAGPVDEIDGADGEIVGVAMRRLGAERLLGGDPLAGDEVLAMGFVHY